MYAFVPSTFVYYVSRIIILDSITLAMLDSRAQTMNSRKMQFSSLLGLKFVNLLKPNGHAMHQHFNIKQLFVLPTSYSCVLYLSENEQRLVPLTT